MLVLLQIRLSARRFLLWLLCGGDSMSYLRGIGTVRKVFSVRLSTHTLMLAMVFGVLTTAGASEDVALEVCGLLI